jgi:CRP-like cAMP-binding protein
LELFAGHLAVLPLFRGLTPLQIAGMARHAERVSYTPGATIVEQDAIADAAILIVAGTAARVSGPEIAGRSEPVIAGSLLGEAAMLVETTYGSTIVARTAVRAVHITRAALHDQMLGDPDLAGRIAANLGRRLSETADILREVEARLGAGAPELPISPPAAELEMPQAAAG